MLPVDSADVAPIDTAATSGRTDLVLTDFCCLALAVAVSGRVDLALVLLAPVAETDVVSGRVYLALMLRAAQQLTA